MSGWQAVGDSELSAKKLIMKRHERTLDDITKAKEVDLNRLRTV